MMKSFNIVVKQTHNKILKLLEYQIFIMTILRDVQKKIYDYYVRLMNI